MGIDYMQRMEGSGNVKSHSRSSLVTTMSPAKTAALIKMPFARQTPGPKEPYMY